MGLPSAPGAGQGIQPLPLFFPHICKRNGFARDLQGQVVSSIKVANTAPLNPK